MRTVRPFATLLASDARTGLENMAIFRTERGAYLLQTGATFGRLLKARA